MSISKRMLLAIGATFALGTAVRAQGQPQGSNQAEDVILDHEAVQLTPEGHARKMRLSESGGSVVKRYGTEMQGHAMFYRENGRNYVLHDRKMPDGRMLFDGVGEWRS